jgi:hypothetical protein
MFQRNVSPPFTLNLKMKAAGSTKILVYMHQRHISQDHNLCIQYLRQQLQQKRDTIKQQCHKTLKT